MGVSTPLASGRIICCNDSYSSGGSLLPRSPVCRKGHNSEAAGRKRCRARCGVSMGLPCPLPVCDLPVTLMCPAAWKLSKSRCLESLLPCPLLGRHGWLVHWPLVVKLNLQTPLPFPVVEGGRQGAPALSSRGWFLRQPAPASKSHHN